MKNTARISALIAALAAGACGSELAGEPGIDLGEADDRLSDYDWQPVISEELQSDALKLESTFTVTHEQDESVTVSGPVYELDVPVKGDMEIELRAPYYMYLTDDLQFLLMTRDDRGNWKPRHFLVEWDRDGVKTLSKISTFDHITFSPEEGKLTAVSGAIGEFELTAEDLADQSARDIFDQDVFGIFALTEEIGLPGILDDLPDNHRTIEGAHEFILEPDCGGIACDAGDFREPAPEPEPAPEETPPGDDVSPEGPVDYYGAVKSIHKSASKPTHQQ